MGDAGEVMRDGEASGQLSAMLHYAQMLTPNRKMLPDRPEVGQKLLGTPGCAKTLHPAFAFPCRLMTMLGPVVDPGCRFHEDMFNRRDRAILKLNTVRLTSVIIKASVH